MIITPLHVTLLREMKPALALNLKAGKGMWSAVRLVTFYEGEEDHWLPVLAAKHGVTVAVLTQTINELPQLLDVILTNTTDEQLLGAWHRHNQKWIRTKTNAEE